MLSAHQEELLQEVARVMARPAKPETDAAKVAKGAAKDVLRQFGRAGTDAFMAAHREGRPRAVSGGAGAGRVQAPVAGYPYAAYGYDAAMTSGGGAAGQAHEVEKQSVLDEVQRLIEQAKANTELLGDMLVNSSGKKDDFESQLINDLLVEVS